MEATLPIIRELTAVGESLMWIVGPGEMVSENYSRGIREPRVHGRYITIRANNWLFHLEPELVGGIEFVETHGDLTSHYVRFHDHEGETLLRAYVPRPRQGETKGEPSGGNPPFEEIRDRHLDLAGVESVRREVRSSAMQ